MWEQGNAGMYMKWCVIGMGWHFPSLVFNLTYSTTVQNSGGALPQLSDILACTQMCRVTHGFVFTVKLSDTRVV